MSNTHTTFKNKMGLLLRKGTFMHNESCYVFTPNDFAEFQGFTELKGRSLSKLVDSCYAYIAHNMQPKVINPIAN